MAYPSTIDAPGGTASQGTSLLTSPDHAQDHRVLGSAVIAIENKVGLGAGSAAANQVLVGSGAGTTAFGSVWNLAQLGTPTIGTPSVVGGTHSAGLHSGTASFSVGTLNNMIMGSPTVTGGTINSVLLGTPTAQRIGSVASSDLRLDADTAGTKVVTFTTVRQGGTTTDWSVGGTTAFPIGNVLIQAGQASCGTTSNVTVTFPVAFSKPPVVMISLQNSSGATLVRKSTSVSTFVFAAGSSEDVTSTVDWIAIGER